MRHVRRVGLAIALVGCRATAPVAYQVEPVPAVIGCVATGCAAPNDQVEITFLGVAGFMIRYRDATLLTAPFFSNPPLRAVAPVLQRLRRVRGVRPDTALVDRLLPAEARDASMIIVGHSHYDHLLDVPYIARTKATHAMIVGSPTMRHILMGDSTLRRAPHRIVALDTAQWQYDSARAFRVMAFAADHAPTVSLFRRWGLLGGLHFAPGRLTHDLDALPTYATQWKVGEPRTYLIDVLEPGSEHVRLRLFYQDTPNTPPLGFPARRVLDERRVDVALVSAATASNVPNTPPALLRWLQPRHVLVGHWESFFRPQTLPIELNVATDVDAFLGALTRALPTDVRWQMPLPRTTYRFDYRP